MTVACLVPLDLWDQLDQQDKKENMDFLVVQDDLVCLGEKGRRGTLLAHRVHLVLLANLDPQEGFLDLMEAHIHWVLKETKEMRGYLESLLYLVFLMVLSSVKVKKVRKATKGRRERRVTQVLLVLQDCQDDQDLWVQRVNQSWAPLVLLVFRDSQVLLEQDVLGQEAHQALLDLQDLHLHMDQSQFLALVVRLDLPDLQDMPSRSQPTKRSTL